MLLLVSEQNFGAAGPHLLPLFPAEDGTDLSVSSLSR